MRVGRLPPGSRLVNECTSGYLQAVLLAADAADGERYTLLLREKEMFSKVLDLGKRPAGAELSCHADAAILWWRRDTRMALERCSIEGCQATTTRPLPALAAKTAAVIPLRDKLALVHRAPVGTTNVRVAHPDELHTTVDTLVFDDARHGGIDVVEMRLVSGDGLALLMFASADGDAYLLRIDANGNTTPVRVVR
jgi:hypothetical protein